MAYEWKDKVVLITGAACGIGAQVARELTRENVQHVAILDIAEDAGAALRDELNTAHGADRVTFIKCDVTDDGQLLDAFKAVEDERGYIDVVINNAGILTENHNGFKKQIEVNLTALVTSTLKAFQLMRRDEGGRGGTIVNVSSIGALQQGPPEVPIYVATKSAVLQFSNCLGSEEVYHSRTGVRVLTVCFGLTNTGLLNDLRCFDKHVEAGLLNTVSTIAMQSVESAARGLVEAYRLGASGSTWVVTRGQPAKDITAVVTQAYALMAEHI